MSQPERLAGGIGEESDLRERRVALAAELRERYQLRALDPLIETCRAALLRKYLSVGVLGRFNAGKSSFLNHLIRRPALPVGVLPVTAIVTDLAGGENDSAAVSYSNGHRSPISIDEIPRYVSETGNPDNRKGVASVSIRVPELLRLGGIRFFDTPGLGSAFAHNTEISQQWAPNVDVALVTVAVDPPLSEHDIGLIRKLLEYTPRVAVLLTKYDLAEPREQKQILDFVNQQLARNIQEPVPVFPYSTRPGYEHLAPAFEEGFLGRLREQIAGERLAITDRKIQTLLRECGDYMRLSLKAAELLDSERSRLCAQATGEKNALNDTKLELRLIARHAIGECRPAIEKALATAELPVRRGILSALDRAAPSFPARLDKMLDAFQDWLGGVLGTQLREVSDSKSREFAQPLMDTQRRYMRLLQNFRDRLSERVNTLYGIPLRTTEPDIRIEPPKAPDVNIGRIFDHNWELLSPILPMTLVRGAVLRRFRKKVMDETFKNISRLTTQWQDIVTAAILELQREAERRIEDLVSTVDRLTSTPPVDAQRIGEDLVVLEGAGSEYKSQDS